MNDKPLAITMGCPASIGPEIILRWFTAEKNRAPHIVVGDLSVLMRCASELDIAAPLHHWQPGESPVAGKLNIWSLSELGESLRWGKPDETTGRAMAGYIMEAVSHINSGNFSGLVTCPISKSSLNGAGYHFPGHTEMLASLCNVDSQVMMMAGKKLRVTLATIHCPLAEVPSLLNQNLLVRIIRTTHRALTADFGIDHPKIAVGGLNPHGGEDGLFGDEEQRIILPAVNAAQAEGINVCGPMPPDTVFFKAARGHFDAVVCMYHDQGLIPFKLLHFEDGVNVTLGLPIIRTSVDHGTAYDIAGQGSADPQSLSAAIELAEQMAEFRNRKKT
ncbi:MAG: 4-hydroxythreonine-4-phosphate dehydrogenase PdxA [Thermodesulfobacteriota bacterium]